MNDDRTNAGSYDIRPIRAKTARVGRYKRALAGLLAAFLLGGVGIPLGVDQYHAYKRAVVLSLIQDELRRLEIGDAKSTGLRLAQCESQRMDLADRLASIAAAVDVDFKR